MNPLNNVLRTVIWTMMRTLVRTSFRVQPATGAARRLRSPRLVLLSLMVLLLTVGCSPALDWREHRFEEGGFTLLFPQKPGRAEKKLATPFGEVTMKMVTVRVEETVFAAASADFPREPDAAVLDAMRNALLKNFDGTVVVDKPVTAAGMPGREIIKRGRIGSGDAVVETDLRAQFFSRGNRYYQLVAAGRRGAIQAADLDLFFASFKPGT